MKENDPPWGKLWRPGTEHAWWGNLNTAANIPDDKLQAFADVLGTDVLGMSVDELRVERAEARARLMAAAANGRPPPQWWLDGPQWWRDLYQNDWTKAPRRWTKKEDPENYYPAPSVGWGDE
jgi:hypothetical protein